MRQALILIFGGYSRISCDGSYQTGKLLKMLGKIG